MSEEPTSPSSKPADDLHGLDPGELLARGLHTVKPTASGGSWEPPTPEELAKLLPQYRIESLLGRGGMGAVYKGVQAALDRPVAIKLLPAELASDGDFLVRFQREARTLAKLQHSGIVAVHDFGQTSAGHLFFVMEFVDGTDLHQILKGPGLKPEQAFVLIAQVCDALHYAHSQGVIHRDIKPANILLTKDGRAKVADFGLARPMTEDSGGLTVTNMVMGTPDYMAPEQRTSATHADHRADIFALGVMLYEMLTGQRPHGAFQPPSHRVQVDVRIDEVVLKALQQEPARRYQQASEMKVDVDRIRTTPPEKPKAAGGRRSVAALIALAAVLVIAAAWLIHQRSGDRALTEQRPPKQGGTLNFQAVPDLPARARAKGIAVEGDVISLNAEPEFYLGVKPRNAVLRIPYSSERFRYLQVGVRLAAGGVQDQVTLFEREMMFVPRGEKAIHHPRSRTSFPQEKGVLEIAVVEDRLLARLSTGEAFSCKISRDGKGGEIMIGGSRGVQIRDVEYANLDGVADPLKALGWEVPEDPAKKTASPSPWQKAVWSDKDLPSVSADGWFSVGDELRMASPFQPSEKRIVFGDGAVRAQVRFATAAARFSPVTSFWLRLPAAQSIHFIISESDLTAKWNNDIQGRVVFDTPFRPGEVERFEAAAVGDAFIARFKGKELRLAYPEAGRSGSVGFHGRNYAVKDVEYAILDGVADPLKALGWEAAAPSRPSSVELRVPIPEWLQKARQEGGRLVFERAADIPAEFNALFDLGAAAQFDDFVELFNTTYAWAALRRNGELWGKTWDAHYKKVSSFGPIQVRSIVRGYSLPVVDAAGSILMFPGSVTIGPGTAGLTRAVGIHAREGRTEVLLDEVGRSLLIRNANPMKAPPPDGFFHNATLLSATTGCFLAAEPGKPLRLWNSDTGRPVVPSEKLDDIVEVSPRAGDFIVLRSTGEAVVLSEKTGQINASSLSAPTDLGPAIRVRSQGSFLAQRADGGWVSWRDGSDKRPDETLPLLAKVGPAIDVLAAMIELPGQVVKGSYVMAIQPRNGPAKTPSAQSTAAAKKRLVEARAHLKAGEAAEAREITAQALAGAPGALDVQAEAALLFADAQAPERAAQLAQDFVAKAEAEHPQFAAVTELRVKLAPTLKRYEQHLRTAAALVGKGDDAGEIRELQAALALVPDGQQAAAKLAANPLHVGRPLPGRRFTHELGHTFVPVDGLPNVLFSAWETRVKDFEQFVKETGHDMSQQRNGHDKTLTWQKPGFEQTGDHPVVMVSRRDANAFCRWLTHKERAAGRLQPGQVYRLPTDREWSAAMGVLDEAGEFPADRKFPADIVTWEKGAPQPHNAENLSGKKNDDFAHTAPVGSGRPNRFGLYDLMGNVKELCADAWSWEHGVSVLRGSSYAGGNQRAELPDNEGPNIWALPDAGFRCVLDFKTEEQRRVQIALEAATQKLIADRAAERAPYLDLHTLVNDEMVLLDANRGVGIMGRSLEPFADIPITHFFADGRFPLTGGRTEAMKKWPLRVLRVTQGFPKEDYLESLRGLPLQWVSINQHIETGMPIKSLAPLAGMKLKGLVLENFKNIDSLEPLRGMPLETLRIRDLSPVVDYTPVKDAPIRHASLPVSASLETLFTVSTWWGEKASLTLPVEAALTAALREPVLAGDAARVQKLVADIEVRLKTIPHFAQGKASEWMLNPFREHLRFAPAVAKWLAGDRAAFGGLAQTHNGHTYLSLPLQFNYEDAKAFAEKLGAHLLTITTPEESAFISKARETKTLSGTRIGLERTGEGRMAWKWVTGEPLDFHNWGPDSGTAGNAAGLTNAGGGVWHWWHWGKESPMSSIIEWDTPAPTPPAANAP